MQPIIFKLCADCFDGLLIFIYNIVLKTNVKTARIIRINKSGDENLVEKYWPIAILPSAVLN